MILTDGAKYNNRLVQQSPTKSMRKNEMVSYMIKHCIGIPSPLLLKPVSIIKFMEFVKQIFQRNILLMRWLYMLESWF